MDKQFVDLSPPNKYCKYYYANYRKTFKFTHLMKLVLVVRKFPDAINMIIDILDKDRRQINKLTNNKMSALMLACMYSNTYSSLETVKLLIEAGADVNFQNSENQTALFLACTNLDTNSNIETIKLLIDSGADINIKDKNSYTALMVTSIYFETCNSLKVVELLIDRGADLNICNCNGLTVLQLILKFLNDIGRSVERVNPANYLEKINLLIKNGTDRRIQYEYGFTILMYIFKYISNLNILETVKLLVNDNIYINNEKYVDNKFYVNIKNRDGETALMYACRMTNSLEIVKLLINCGANVNSECNEGTTALMYACDYDLNTAKFLLENGADANIVSRYRQSALIYMCSNKLKESDKEMLMLLLMSTKKVIIQIRDDNKKTAFDYYIEYNFFPVDINDNGNESDDEIVTDESDDETYGILNEDELDYLKGKKIFSMTKKANKK